jgi:hypothetical protein
LPPYSALALGVIVLLALPGFNGAGTLGFSAGDSVTYVYEIHSFSLTIAGHKIFNETTTQKNIETLDILSTNTTGRIGAILFRETIPVFNSTTLATPSVGQNLTAIFNPYDSSTYLGKIGFYPFTYNNLPAGSARNVAVTVPITNYPGFNGTVYGHAKVNATVARDSRYIFVNCTVGFPQETPFHMDMKYNATTGVLINMTTRASYFGTPQILTYQLTQYVHSPIEEGTFYGVSYTYIGAGLVVAVIALLAANSVLHRKTGKERTAERLREKMKRKP